MKNSFKLSSVILFVCILLILSFSFEMLLPHTHVCQDKSCPICNLSEVLKRLISFCLIGAAFFCLEKILFCCLSPVCGKRQANISPVILKVKLSN